MTIGFKDNSVFEEKNKNEFVKCENGVKETPIKSVVTINFGLAKTYDYYNDMFDLKPGDCVYVSGKLEGRLGIVESVNTEFKISLKYYQKVVLKVVRQIHGKFNKICGHMISFDEIAPDFSQVENWFAMKENDDEIVCSENGLCVNLGNVRNRFDNLTLEKAVDILENGKLKYLTIREAQGYAIVEGSNNNAYTVNFTYENGEIKNMFCDCFLSNECKHEAAVAMFLEVIIPKIEDKYMSEYNETKCITAFDLGEFCKIVFDSNSPITV